VPARAARFEIYHFVFLRAAQSLAVAPEDEPERMCDCPVCGRTMTLASVIPRLGGLPKLMTFQCLKCNEVMTIEDDE
jgi:C4-type Zn-finger protein